MTLLGKKHDVRRVYVVSKRITMNSIVFNPFEKWGFHRSSLGEGIGSRQGGRPLLIASTGLNVRNSPVLIRAVRTN